MKPMNGERKTLELFEKAARNVVAYKKFLKKNHLNATDISRSKDFLTIPIMNKSNYLRRYPLKELTWKGSMRHHLIFTSTSGSTGEPFYFPREKLVDNQAAWVHDLFYKYRSDSKDKSTLVIVCFGMGVWIGGILTYQAFKIMGDRGESISILTPGINKAEIFNALKKIAYNFDEVIMVGYAPFIKDIVDEAPSQGVNLRKMNVRLIFAAEAFTEGFRDYIAKKAGLKNVLLDTMNIYGSADIGAMAFETPISILMRRLAQRKPELFDSLFSSISKTPTFAQYNPEFIHFVSNNGRILLSGDSTIPLIKYDIGDHGGTMTFREVVRIFRNHGINILREAEKAGISKTILKFPFVYVYERADLSTTLYGLQIYPETVREALLTKPISTYLTGKVTLITRYDHLQNQYLEINLELQKNKNASQA